MRYVLIAVVLCSSVAMAAPCSNTSLGNSWTCVWGGYNTGSTGVQRTYDVAQQAHDILVAFCDTGNANNNGGQNIPTDTVGNTYVQVFGPIAWKASPDGINGDATMGVFLAYDAKAASAGANTVTCSGSTQGSAFADVSLSIFRNTAASPGYDVKNSAVVNTSSGTCPEGGTGNLVPSISITTTNNAELIIAVAQNNGSGPTAAPSGWLWSDGVGYIFARSQTSAGAISLQYCLGTATDINDNAVETLIGINPPGTTPTGGPSLKGATLANGAKMQ